MVSLNLYESGNLELLTQPKTKKDRNPILLTTQQAAEKLGLSPRTLFNLRVVGGGPQFVTIGKSVRYPLDDLMEYYQNLPRFHNTTECRLSGTPRNVLPHSEANNSVINVPSTFNDTLPLIGGENID